MNDWPSVLCRLGASARASVSVEPPGGNGTTSVTVLFGQVWAWAAAAVSRPSASMASSFFNWLLHGFRPCYQSSYNMSRGCSRKAENGIDGRRAIQDEGRRRLEDRSVQRSDRGVVEADRRC